MSLPATIVHGTSAPAPISATVHECFYRFRLSSARRGAAVLSENQCIVFLEQVPLGSYEDSGSDEAV